MEHTTTWLGQLPHELAAQRRLLQRLLDWCERDQDVRSLTVGCSMERGNADRLSDLDVAIGVKEEHFVQALARVRQALGQLGELVEATTTSCRSASRCDGSSPSTGTAPRST